MVAGPEGVEMANSEPGSYSGRGAVVSSPLALASALGLQDRRLVELRLLQRIDGEVPLQIAASCRSWGSAFLCQGLYGRVLGRAPVPVAEI